MKRFLICAILALGVVPVHAQGWSTSSGNTTTTDKVGIGTTAPANGLEIANTTAVPRLIFSGAEFFAPANTSTSGLAFLLGVNRTGNRQLWLGDSANLTPNAFNTVMRMAVFPSFAQIDAISTDVSTKKLLVVGNSGNVELATGGGKVGIGTNAPASLLHLKSATSLDLTLDGASYAQIYQPNAADMYFTIGGATGDMIFRGAGSAEFLRIRNTGLLGIGTSAPAALLHVSGANRGISPYVLIDRTTNAFDAALGIRTNGNATTQWLFGKSAASISEDLVIGYGDLQTANQRLVVTTAGNVGIGRTAPSAKLDVNGAIKGNSHLAFMPWTNVAPSTTTGYVRLTTPVADTEGNVVSLHILGYEQSSSAPKAIDIRCSGYASGGALSNRACTAAGTDAPVEITTEPTGGVNYVVVRIGSLATSWASSFFSVEYDGTVAHDSSGFTWSVASAVPSGAPALVNTNNVAIRNSGGGAVEIGQPTAVNLPDQTTRLTVHGSVVVDGNIAAKYQDLAEWVPVASKLSAGTVVVVSRARRNEVIASTRAYDTAVAGVVSAQPGLILGERSDSKAKIATTGRVLVHVDATKHPIEAGDLLVTGEKPGTAMYSEPVDLGGIKMHRPGTLVGKALEPLSTGEGDILVLLSLQ
jgi:hypothetical protein